MWGFEHYDVVPDVVTFAKGMSAGFAVCGAVTTPEIAEKASGTKGLPWAGTYSSDPLACAVALKQLQIVLRDKLVEHAAMLGDVLESGLEDMKNRHECIGDVRGKGFYRMLDIVTDPESRTPDPEMAERIRYHALAAGLVMICVKNYIRISPPSIMTKEEVKEVIDRLDKAITRAKESKPTGADFRSSSSLAADPAYSK
jgi:2,2-dialkylglycine decarboxylase (pyruvate)